MNQIKNYIEAMFSSLPKTQEVIEMKLTMLENTEEKFQELINHGKNENEAVGIILADFGSMEELKDELGLSDIELNPIEASSQHSADLSLKEEYFNFKKKYSLALACATALFILAPAVFLLLRSTYGHHSSIAYLFFFSLIACGAGICTYFGIQDNKYKDIVQTDEPDKTDFLKLIRSIIFIIAAIFYLCLGFLWNLWHPGWIVFLVAVAINRIIRAVINYKKL
jgi:hypothetical protein